MKKNILNNLISLSFLLLFTICSNKAFSQNSTTRINKLIETLDQTYTKGNVDKKKTLNLAADIYYLSKEAKFIHGQTYSIFEEVRIYYFDGNFELSLKKINEGIALAKLQEDYDMLCRLLLIYQSSLLRLGYPIEAQQILKKCDEYNDLNISKENKRINDIYITLSQADLLVDDLGLSTDMSAVLLLKKKALSETLELNDSNKYKKITLIYCLESLAWSAALSGNLDEARKYTQQIDQLLVNFPNEYSIIQNLIIKGAIENLSKNYHQAVVYFSETIVRAKKSNSIYKLYETYPMISVSYNELKDFENATVYSWKFKYLSDSISQVKKKYDNISLINKINSQINNPPKKNIFNAMNVGIIVFILILALIGVLFYKKAFMKNIPVKENEEVLQDANLHHITNTENIEKLVSLAKNDINSYYLVFQKYFPSFYRLLKEKYPDLTIMDLNFCSLIKMNFEVKEISLYCKSSTRSVESRKYRVMKKMGVKNQNELYITISAIE